MYDSSLLTTEIMSLMDYLKIRTVGVCYLFGEQICVPLLLFFKSFHLTNFSKTSKLLLCSPKINRIFCISPLKHILIAEFGEKKLTFPQMKK